MSLPEIPELPEYVKPNPAKPLRILNEWKDPRLHPQLRAIFLEMAERRWEAWRLATYITSIYRSGWEDKSLSRAIGPHNTWRAIDGSINKKRLGWEEELALEIIERYPTGMGDDMRRIALPLNHGTGPHDHIQVTRPEMQKWVLVLQKEMPDVPLPW